MDLFYILTGPVRRMSHVHRYSSITVHRRENVAEHSWWVMFIAMLIADDLRAQGELVKLDKVVLRALVHDLDECVSGDIIRSFKYRTEAMRLAVHEASDENMREITSKMGSVGGLVFPLWRDSKDDSIEGQIVRFADMASVVFYCREERRQGNLEIEEIMKEMYETWFKEYHNHEVLARYADQLFPNRSWYDAFTSLDLGPTMTMMRPLMRDHSEGPVTAHEWPDGRNAL